MARGNKIKFSQGKINPRIRTRGEGKINPRIRTRGGRITKRAGCGNH